MRETERERHHYSVIKHPYGVNVELVQIPRSLAAEHPGREGQE